MAIKLLLIIFLFSSLAHASKVSIEIQDKEFRKAPAADLVYKDQRIDDIEALELQRKGLDLSTLDPYRSNLWSNQNLDAENYRETNYPDANQSLVFESFKASPSEFFRAHVQLKSDPSQRFLIIAGLDNHTNIIRAALLRNLGYNIHAPKYMPELKVEFSSTEQLDKFMELLGEQTLTKRDKWLIKKDGTIAVLKGFIIEPAKLENVNVYMPVMNRDRQQERRIFRALLDIYVLTDFPQDVNKIGWTTGRNFNNAIIFNHPYAAEFNDTTIEDIRWIHRRLTKLSYEQISESVKLAGYPQDIGQLVLQKLLSRINYLSKLYGLKNVQLYPVKSDISIGNVKAGKLTKGEYPKHVVEFFNEDPLSPYRFSEISRLFGTQLFYSALSGGLDMAIEKFVPGLRINDAADDIRKKMQSQQNGTEPGTALPTKFWTAPLVNGRVFGSRRIIFGQFLNSTAPIQLVDSVGAEVNLGMYGSLTGVPRQIMPNMNASANLSRNYIHVRAMPDLKTASKQRVEKLLIPRHMKKLGSLINNHIKCTIPEKVWVVKETLNGQPIYYIKYDEKIADAKEAAIKKREELLKEGIPTSQLLLVKSDRDTLCNEEMVSTRNKNLEEFLKQFAENETFIINDSLRLGVNVTASVPLTPMGAPQGASAIIGADSTGLLLRSIVLKKTADGFEVTVQQQRDIGAGLDFGLNYYISIMKASSKWTNGRMLSRVYKIKLEQVSDSEKKTALSALRHLFVYNNRALLQEHYQPYLLDHKISSRLDTFRILFYKTEGQVLDHTVDITIPKKESDPEGTVHTRTLYSASKFLREGNDYYSLADKALTSLVPLLSLGSNEGGDPGKSFYGESVKRSYVTETELTKSYPANTVVRVETNYSGWGIPTPKLYEKFDAVEAWFYPFTDVDTINKSLFHGSPKLMSYDIRNSILIYPEALEKIKKDLFLVNEAKAVSRLSTLFGHKNWDNYCQNARRFFGDHKPQAYFGDKDYDCMPPSVQKLLNLRRKGIPSDRKAYCNFINETVSELFEYYKRDELLYWLGNQNIFATTRVTGFRTQNVEGAIEHISDSVGKYNVKLGTGLFDSISSVLGLSSYELRALNYTPGF